MKTKKTILSAVLALAMCFSMIVGGTYALFTSESTTNIAVTSGTIEVLASIDESKIHAYSPTLINMDGTVEDDTNAANGLVFKNGGSVAYDKSSATLSLINITPGDKVDFEIDVDNNSNVTIQYRVVISAVEGGSLNGLVMKINNVDYAGDAVNCPWDYAGAQGPIASIPVSIELPAGDDTHQSMTTKLSITVEAVQGNANTESTEAPPAVVAPGTLAELQEAFALAASQSTGDMVIEITKNFDVENGWTMFVPQGYNGVNDIIVNGNGFTITNLNEPLFGGSFAGSGSITINNLTIANSNISHEAYNNLGVGAFVAYSDSSGSVTLNNCHLKSSTVVCTGSSANDPNGYAGGLVGYVSTPATFTNCSVTGSTITGHKSVGAILGHGGANVTVDGCTVTGNTITENMPNRTSAGAAAIAGRMNGGCTLTLKGTITVTGNTITQGAAVVSAPANIYTANAEPNKDEATLVTE